MIIFILFLAGMSYCLFAHPLIITGLIFLSIFAIREELKECERKNKQKD
jgi:hypothetical protein